MRKFDLQERLIDFAVHIIEIEDKLKGVSASRYLGDQILRSGISPALNYGEAQGSESRKDFIHKMKISLKELRETNINLLIIKRANLHQEKEKLDDGLKECNELTSTFVKSIETAKRNLAAEISVKSSK
ncbi:MAG: four helix bundle protein [Bacteroidetes bacterium]|nr:four helix bundle protein [Bacteroidota bacterium]MBU1719249.1 four helix bundle protein [Bacteroidota bacterium]